MPTAERVFSKSRPNSFCRIMWSCEVLTLGISSQIHIPIHEAEHSAANVSFKRYIVIRKCETRLWPCHTTDGHWLASRRSGPISVLQHLKWSACVVVKWLWDMLPPRTPASVAGSYSTKFLLFLICQMGMHRRFMNILLPIALHTTDRLKEADSHFVLLHKICLLYFINRPGAANRQGPPRRIRYSTCEGIVKANCKMRL
jgi:hypothetical protein